LGEAIAARTRMEMIGLFLAVLELARGQRIAIRQAGRGGSVELEWIGESGLESTLPAGALDDADLSARSDGPPAAEGAAES